MRARLLLFVSALAIWAMPVVAQDYSSMAATADEQAVAQELLRENLGPLSRFVNVWMLVGKYDGRWGRVSLEPKDSGYFLDFTPQYYNGTPEPNLNISLDKDMRPLLIKAPSTGTARTYVVHAVSEDKLLLVDVRTPGYMAAVQITITAKGEMNFRRGILQNGNFIDFKQARMPGAPGEIYSPRSPQEIRATLAKLGPSNNDSSDPLGRALFGAMVGGWTGKNVGDMATGASAALQGPRAFNQELANRAAAAQVDAVRSEANFRESLNRMRARQAGSSGASFPPATESGPPRLTDRVPASSLTKNAGRSVVGKPVTGDSPGAGAPNTGGIIVSDGGAAKRAAEDAKARQIAEANAAQTRAQADAERRRYEAEEAAALAKRQAEAEARRKNSKCPLGPNAPVTCM